MTDTDYPLLATKLYISKPRSDLVPRPRLIERLNSVIQCKVSLVSAPAGFGKTTLLSEWADQSKLPVAWVSLDNGDNDLVYFLKYVIAALQTIEPKAGEATLALLQSMQQPSIDAVLINLIQEIENIPNDFVLVLDDYHCIDTAKIHQRVAYLIDRMPPQMHLVLATRVDPAFPLARLRVRKQINEFRVTDLCFTLEETTLFFNQVMKLGLSDQDITILESRTEGWVAGLQLAALSMQGRSDIPKFIKAFAGDDRLIVDYLVEEVLNLQSDLIRHFLLHTSILKRLSGPLCDFVTNRKDSRKMLDELEKANLFIFSLDNQRRWYRYHHLFAVLLQQRLHQKHSDRLHDLHKRASEWYEHNKLREEAIEHALMAKDFKRAARLVLELAEVMWKRGKPARLFRWLEALPDEYVLSSPNLCIIYAWILCDNGQPQAAEQRLQTAERIVDSIHRENAANSQVESKRQPSLTVRDLQGRIAAVRAYRATGQGDVQSIVESSEKALKFLHQNDATWRAGVAMSLGMAHTIKGDNSSAVKALSEAVSASKAAGNGSLYLISNIWLAVRLKDYGQLQRTIDICKHLFGVLAAEKLTNTAAEGGLISIWGEVLYELNELDEALRYEKKSLLLLEQGHHVGARGWAYLCLLKILTAKKDFSGIEELIREIEKLERTSDVPPWVTPWTEAWKARIWLMRGNLDRAVSWAKERGLKVDDDLNPLREPEYIMLARILIAQDRLNDAMELLKRLIKAEEKGGRILRQIETLLLKTLILKEQRNINESLITLGTALSLAEPGGYIRIFLDEGSRIAELLEKMLDGKPDVARAYVKRLLSAFRVGKTIEAKDGLVENLSERELEVLRLIANGLSNKKITEALFVSLSTVKTHLRNIYGKLNVHSRTEAIVRAKALGLL